MAIRLRVILDQLLSTVPGGIGRYATELTRELIASAPAGASVTGVVSRAGQASLDRVRDLLPGLDPDLEVVPLGRRELALAWQFGLAATLPAGTSTHTTSQLAPLVRHSRHAHVAVTIHDAVPWTHPRTLTRRGAQWHRAMGERARRYADAIVVPTSAAAAELADFIDFGDRVRVIGGAPAAALRAPSLAGDADARAAALGLPARYVLAVGTLEPRKGLDALIAAMAHPSAPAIPLVIAGPPGWGGIDVHRLAAEAGLPADRLLVLGRVSDADLAVAYHRAAVFAFPSRAEGFGLPVIEAMRLGAPVVHSDAPAVAEVAGGAGRTVPLEPADSYPARLAAELAAVADDATLAATLAAAGRRRAEAFSWRRSAEAVWRLHADLA
jgi:glycosyltransferase involved in cell wall biosynthesis